MWDISKPKKKPILMSLVVMKKKCEFSKIGTFYFVTQKD